jgi:heptosyltransferase-2
LSTLSPKILVIRFSSIGDIVLTTPVLRGLKNQLGAKVHFLTKAAYADIIRPNPNVDKVIVLDSSLVVTLEDLKKEAYDHIIDLHHNLRSLRIKLSLGVPAKSFRKLNVEKWLLTNLKINQLPTVHIVDRYLETVSPLGVKNDGKGLDFFFTDYPSDSHRASSDFQPGADYIAFAIGAAHATKRLPVEKIIAICSQLDYPVHLLGGPGDQNAGDTIAAACHQVINHCGHLSLEGSAKIVRGAAVVISHDTGMMHIAAALRKPILSIWGNTVPAFGMWAYYPEGIDLHQRFEVKDLACRPCSKIGYDRCPKGHFRCMKQQDVRLIVKQAKQILKKLDS